MIITDGVHVVSTESLEELHVWAKRNGISRQWFHGTRKGHPHYDVPVRRVDIVERLVFHEFRLCSPREILKSSKRIYEQQQLP